MIGRRAVQGFWIGIVTRLRRVLLGSIILATPSAFGALDHNGLWQPFTAPSSKAMDAVALRFDRLAWNTLLQVAEQRTHPWPLEIDLPLPDGRLQRFSIMPNPLMSEALAERLPQLRVYHGRAVDDATTRVAVSVSAAGLRAMILGAARTVFIDPQPRWGQGGHRSVFRRSSSAPDDRPFCRVRSPQGRSAAPKRALETLAWRGSLDDRLYRLAVAATGEYTQVFGSRQSAMTAIVETFNRVSEIFHRDLGVRFELVDNTKIVFTSPDTDPYPSVSIDALLDVNQEVLDTHIGSRRYDVGHLLTVGGVGGIAALSTVCETFYKGQAVSSGPVVDPAADTFIVDIIAHELGHQFGAEHTFNSERGLCGPSDGYSPRVAQSAWEPGSGSTIMSYAGLCFDSQVDENIQNHSDDYLHGGSIDQILRYIAPLRCGTTLASGNQAPLITAASGVTIPEQTPFELSGVARDPDDDPLSFLWEQVDLGPPTMPDETASEGPVFRSFAPSSSPTRVVPRLEQLLGEVDATVARWEVLPSVSRTLNFLLTVRDGRGGVAQSPFAVTVKAGNGPFEVISPSRLVTWRGYETREIRWRIAGTDRAPIDCPALDIFLSTDGGRSFPLRVDERVANDGQASIQVPNVDTDLARFKLKCADNVFFALSAPDIRIRPGEPNTDELLNDGFESGTLP